MGQPTHYKSHKTNSPSGEDITHPITTIVGEGNTIKYHEVYIRGVGGFNVCIIGEHRCIICPTLGIREDLISKSSMHKWTGIERIKLNGYAVKNYGGEFGLRFPKNKTSITIKSVKSLRTILIKIFAVSEKVGDVLSRS